MNMSAEQQIDRLCDEFEAELRDGGEPSISDLLPEIDADYRDQLFEQLLLVEVDVHDSKPSMDHYLRQYPERAEIVKSVYGRDDTRRLDDTSVTDPSTAIPTIRVDPYSLVRKIGEGGMGTVWLARQQAPIQRNVALKLIKAEYASEEIIERFDAERQALAIMDHPNIAKIHDAGATEAGSPYFVMELVEGTPLTTYCDENKLTIEERLELFLPVCLAVQHAHQKGIIHRDLKPSNVLVGVYDGEPIPKVIDFGLAKALDHTTRLTDKTIQTQVGKVVGTLQYMSPEQADTNALDIDTRADVYSLGVILYELLTGATPLQRASIAQKPLLAVLESIRQQESPKPSQRLDSLEDTIDIVSGDRQTTPSRLQQILRGELDWVAMRALEPDRLRRYQTASELADDISRYLNDEPVEARPPSANYRLMKFVRKNRVLVASSAAIVTLLVAGIVGTTYGLVKARRSAIRERHAKEQAITSSQRSEDVLGIVTRSFNSTNPTESDAGMAAKEVLFNAQKILESSQLDDHGRAEVLKTLADCFVALGEYDLAINVGTEEVEVRSRTLGRSDPTTLRAMSQLGYAYIEAGEIEEAVSLLTETLQHRREMLGDEHDDTLTTKRDLALAYRDGGNLKDAIEQLELVLEVQRATLPDGESSMKTMLNLGVAYRMSKRLDEAIDLLQETRELGMALHPEDHPDVLTVTKSLATAYSETGRVDDAIPLFERMLAQEKIKLGEDHPATFGSLYNLGQMYLDADRVDDAIPTMEQAWQGLKGKLGEDHPHALIAMGGVASAYHKAEQFDEALQLGLRALELKQTKLGEDHLFTLDSMYNVANTYHAAGRFDEAIELQEKTVKGMQQARGTEHVVTLISQSKLGEYYQAADRVKDSLDVLSKTVVQMEAAIGRTDPNTLACIANLGASYQLAKDWGKAIPLLKEVVNASEEHPELAAVRQHLRDCYIEARREAEEQGDDEAVEKWQQALDGL